MNYGRWMWRVVSWDTLLPAFISIVPFGIELAFPKIPGVMLTAAVALPIMAFFIRIRVGTRQIAANHCTDFGQQLQMTVLMIGIVPLIMIDSMLVAAHLMPPGALFADGSDLRIWAALFAIYLTAMVIAMYPGRETIPSDDRTDFPLS